MPTHCIHEEKETFYFTTFTCHRWLPLLERAEIHAYLPGWIDQLSSRGLIICGYVMMPNHLHLLLYVTADCKGLNQVLGDGKRFMAYEVVSKLKKLKEEAMLGKLEEGVQANERVKGKRHQVFRLSFDAKEVVGDENINKVLDYMHHNPVSGKWNLVEDYTRYPYSSAGFYEKGEVGIVKIVDFRSVISESSASDSEGIKKRGDGSGH
ncbi:hypothetical protein [Ekhidna sp.]|uniref:hypothetical protein n=1 Tax=Ekhidna sp. TaxID=2608089 RepID=UPI0032EE3158